MLAWDWYLTFLTIFVFFCSSHLLIKLSYFFYSKSCWIWWTWWTIGHGYQIRPSHVPLYPIPVSHIQVADLPSPTWSSYCQIRQNSTIHVVTFIIFASQILPLLETRLRFGFFIQKAVSPVAKYLTQVFFRFHWNRKRLTSGHRRKMLDSIFLTQPTSHNLICFTF